MIIGVPKEIKNHEYRIGLTPAGVKELSVHGHEVIVESNGGASIGFDNEQYIAAGAKIINSAAEIFATADMIIKVKEPQGAVIVDVAIDQGGCFATSKATTHQDPTYVVDGVVHYCVANMPGGVARTSTMALTNATMPFAVTLANKGAKQALLDDEHLLAGLNVIAGNVTYQPVADVLGYEYVDPRTALNT